MVATTTAATVAIGDNAQNSSTPCHFISSEMASAEANVTVLA